MAIIQLHHFRLIFFLTLLHFYYLIEIMKMMFPANIDLPPGTRLLTPSELANPPKGVKEVSLVFKEIDVDLGAVPRRKWTDFCDDERYIIDDNTYRSLIKD